MLRCFPRFASYFALLGAFTLLPLTTPAFAAPTTNEHTATTAASTEGDRKDSDGRTAYKGSEHQNRYTVRAEDSDLEEQHENDDGANGTEEDSSGSAPEADGSETPNRDPLKIYIGDPFTANVDREVDVVPDNLCRISPGSDEVDYACRQITNVGCAEDASVLSYELGDGTSRARCVSNDEIEQAIQEIRGEGQETLPTAAHTAFMDLSLEPAVVKFEPDLLGFGYKGRHTNMYADVDTETVSQELLGQTVQIRAIPQEFHWDYGDGTSRTTFEPGGPLPDYDGTGQEIVKTDFKTVTSHIYEETGIYPVTVETVYTGQFRVGDGEWRDIPGTVSVESSPGEADIWTQNSRWVSGACESTEQWGCNGPVEFDPATDRPPKIYQDQYDENGRWLGPVE